MIVDRISVRGKVKFRDVFEHDMFSEKDFQRKGEQGVIPLGIAEGIYKSAPYG